MTSSKIIKVYRSLAMVITTLPIVNNVFLKGDIVTSLLYVPLFSLALLCIAIVIDAKVEKALQFQRKALPAKEISDIQPLLDVQPLMIKKFHHAVS